MAIVRKTDTDAPARTASLLVSLGLAESGTEVAANWLSRSFTHVAALWPLMLLAKLCVAALLGMLSFTRPEHGALLCGVVLIDGLLMLVPRWALFRNLRPHVQNWLMLPALFCSGLIFSLWLAQGNGVAMPSAVPEMAIALLAVCIVGDRRLLGLSYFMGALLVAGIAHAGMVLWGCWPAAWR